MKVIIGKRIYCLKSDPSSTKSIVSLKSLPQTRSTGGEGFFIEFGENLLQQIATQQKNPEIQALLSKFPGVCEAPKGLPPTRTHHHFINLKDGAQPPNIRPYCYPYSQKVKIEKLVNWMFLASIIQPRCNPYSSSVMLVKEKDGSWRFCVDYRALNNLTIPDKFPISTIEELLDELGTAKEHYEFMVIPFGLSNALSTFQALMNDVFKEQLQKFILVSRSHSSV